jgi:hypothetical protein
MGGHAEKATMISRIGRLGASTELSAGRDASPRLLLPGFCILNPVFYLLY